MSFMVMKISINRSNLFLSQFSLVFATELLHLYQDSFMYHLCWYQVNWEWIPPLVVVANASGQLLETRLSSSLHKWCSDGLSKHSPKPKSDSEMGRNPLRESRWESSWYYVPEFYFNGVFIMLKGGKHSSVELAFWPNAAIMLV